MDELARYNQERWDALVDAGIQFSRPIFDLDVARARTLIDPHGVIAKMLGDVADRSVLCLAGGGGQQSAAFALLGAQVTVLDLSQRQLEQDRAAATHYGREITIRQGDMRNLTGFADDSFDIVFQPYSINFVPDVNEVFTGVRRILRQGGLYRLEFGNPLAIPLDERHWNGVGYPLNQPYQDGEIVFDEAGWDVADEEGQVQIVEGPREFIHTLGTVLTGLATHGFRLLGLWEFMEPDPNPPPGTWQHYTQVCPPWYSVWLQLDRNSLAL
jgi:SAM-dependent methyltransferase